MFALSYCAVVASTQVQLKTDVKLVELLSVLSIANDTIKSNQY